MKFLPYTLQLRSAVQRRHSGGVNTTEGMDNQLALTDNPAMNG